MIVSLLHSKRRRRLENATGSAFAAREQHDSHRKRYASNDFFVHATIRILYAEA
jgi:hypothetical protein